MKKRNTAIRALSVFLAYAMVCTSVPAAGQEMFGSGVNRETEENTSDLKEFQSSQADEFGTDTGSDAELFGSDDAKQEFQDGENSEEGTDGIRYIKGRPLTEEERKEELEPFKNLKPLDPGIEVESDLTSVCAAYGNREAAFPSSYDARKEGLVTLVKNQNPFGTCWAFGMAAIMETSLLAQNKGTYDLSEEHLSYFFSNRQNDPLGNTPDDKNYVLGNYHVIGGNDHLAAIYLSTWSGMTTEADVPFPTDSSHQQDLTVQIPGSKAYNSAAYLKNDEDVADAIQDTILSCYENLKSLKQNRYFKTWMIRILINKCKDMIQKKKLVTYTDQMPETPFHEEKYAAMEWIQALEPLDSKYRLVVLLYYMEGFGIREISDILDMKESTVKSRLYRGRKQIAEMYGYKVKEGRA